MSTFPVAARAFLGASLAALLSLGGSLLLARYGRHGFLRWPAAVTIVLAIVAAAVVGVVAGD